jgi:hypothetical protein
MFSRRRDRGAVADPDVDRDEEVEGRTDVRRDEVVERRDDLGRDEVVERGRKERAWGGPPLVRAVFTLAGVGAAGFLVWLATLFELEQTSEFWSAMGLVAAGGLALGLSQLFGGWTKWGVPVLSPGVFLFAFIPTGIVVAWILMTTQPEGGWQQERLSNWSDDIGILGFVEDMGVFGAVLAFGLGLVLAFSFDTTGPRTRVHDRETVVPDEDVHDYERREVTTSAASERTEVTTPASERTVVRDEETVPAGTQGDTRRDVP